MIKVIWCGYYNNFPFSKNREPREEVVCDHRNLYEYLKKHQVELVPLSQVSYRDLRHTVGIIVSDLPWVLSVGSFRPKYIYAFMVTHTIRDFLKLVYLRITKTNCRAFKKILLTQEPRGVLPENYFERNHRFFDAIFTQDLKLEALEPLKYKYFSVPFDSCNTNFKSERDYRLSAISSNNCYVPSGSGNPNSRSLLVTEFCKHLTIDEFYLFGRGWTGIPHARGTVLRKNSVIQRSLFHLVIENTVNEPGYVSEKVFHCLVGGAIPIYYGNASVCRIIPNNLLFHVSGVGDVSKLVDHIRAMSSETINKMRMSIMEFVTSSYFNELAFRRLGNDLLSVLVHNDEHR